MSQRSLHDIEYLGSMDEDIEAVVSEPTVPCRSTIGKSSLSLELLFIHRVRSTGCVETT